VTGLPFSAASRVVFTLDRTTGVSAGAVPRAAPPRRAGDAGRRGAAAYGQLGLKRVPLRPAFAHGKGFIERTAGAGRPLGARRRRHPGATSLGGPVRDAWVERQPLRRLPVRWPEVDACIEVRAGAYRLTVPR